MKKMVLADYLATCDENNNPIGHTVKVLNEYTEMLSHEYEVRVATAENTNKKVKSQNKICTPYSINLGVTTKKEKLLNIIKRLKNLSYIFKQGKGYPIWICSSDFYVFLYMFFKPKRKNKVFITLYMSNFDGGSFSKIKNWIFRKAVKKADLIICSDKNLKIDTVPIFHMPDYLYREEQYKAYHTKEKAEKVVCLGTMGKNKLLPEVIDAFNQNGYPLEITGKFFDMDLYEELVKKAKDNIKVKNDYISDEEYLDILSSAKYAILPYNMHMYKERTSGVILESVFVNTIPVASKSLLDFMKIPGIGYDDMKELESMDFFQNDRKNDYADFIRENYSYVEIGKRLIECMEDILVS